MPDVEAGDMPRATRGTQFDFEDKELMRRRSLADQEVPGGCGDGGGGWAGGGGQGGLSGRGLAEESRWEVGG
jgi:hypothetical protein